MEEIYLFSCTNEDWLYTILVNVEGEFVATAKNWDLAALSERALRSKGRCW